MISNGQGTIEYLVILAVVIVIGLVVVGLVANQVDSTQTISASSDIKNKIGVSGISIVESVAGEDGNGLVVLRNNGSDNLIISHISINGVDHNYSESIVVGSQKSFKLQDLPICEGEKKVYSIEVHFVTSNNLSKTSDFDRIAIECISVVDVQGGFIDENKVSVVDETFSDCTLDQIQLNCNSSREVGCYCGGGVLVNPVTSLVVENTGLKLIGNVWGPVGDVTGASSNSGAVNSQTIQSHIESTQYTIDDYLALKICDSLVSNGKSDWYLPAYEEIWQITSSGLYGVVILQDVFWTSTETSENNARLVDFGFSESYGYQKSMSDPMTLCFRTD